MRERDLVLDAVALSALLDERKADHQHAQSALLAWVSSEAGTDRDAATPFVIPAITLYEVRRGLLKIGATRRVDDLDRFVRAYGWVEDFDEHTAEVAAKLWAERSRTGMPAGERDLLILASAVVVDGDVVTADTGFPTTDGVAVLTWQQVAEELDRSADL